MLRLSTILLFIFPALASGARLPKLRPADFRAQVVVDGGMNGFHRIYTVRGDSTLFELSEPGLHQRHAFATPVQALDSLYAMLRSCDFGGMRAKAVEGDPWGAGGHMVSLLAGGEMISRSTFGENRIARKCQGKFMDGVHAITSFVSKCMEPYLQDVRLDFEYPEDLQELELNLGSDFHAHWRAIEALALPGSFSQRMLPGQYLFTGYLTTAGTTIEFTHFIEIAAGTNILHFKATREGLFRIEP